ncbi:hypothetical protein KUCAC02_014765, partial [Chaenocephalus aceratus]
QEAIRKFPQAPANQNPAQSRKIPLGLPTTTVHAHGAYKDTHTTLIPLFLSSSPNLSYTMPPPPLAADVLYLDCPPPPRLSPIVPSTSLSFLVPGLVKQCPHPPDIICREPPIGVT